MKYIRTKDGRIIDIEAFINKEKENPYYSDYEFEEIKNDDDTCVIKWTAIGTELNTIKEQVFKKCNFGATIDSPFIAQADTIEELCDEFVFVDEFFKREHRVAYSLENALARCKYHDVDITTLRGAIWTDKGLIYVAKMNEKGELELL